MTRARIEKLWPVEEEMNEKHEEGGATGLREDCACLVIEIIICNHLPRAKDVLHGREGGGLIPGQREQN